MYHLVLSQRSPQYLKASRAWHTYGAARQVALSCYGSKLCTSLRVMYGWVHDIDLILHGPAEDVGSLSISLAHIFSCTSCQVSYSALDNPAAH